MNATRNGRLTTAPSPFSSVRERPSAFKSVVILAVLGFVVFAVLASIAAGIR
jgi:hypothetical protein